MVCIYYICLYQCNYWFMHEWDNFFVAAAGASAALTGLLFVGISINLARILSLPRLPERALLSLVLLLSALVSSLLFLVPGQGDGLLGIELLVLSLAVWVNLLRLEIVTLRNKEREYRRQYIMNMTINQATTTLYVLQSLALLGVLPGGRCWIVPAVLMSMLKSVLDGWVLLVEINR